MLFAVSYINFLDNELETKFIEAESDIEALKKSDYYNDHKDFFDEESDLDRLKELAFDIDSMFEVVPVPRNAE